jgi:arsenical pump membrane protein
MEASIASQFPTAVAVDSGRIVVCGLVLCTSVSVALVRPRIRAVGGLGPTHAALLAIAAVLVTGSCSVGELGRAYYGLVRPLSAIAGIMVMAAAVRRSGLLTALATRFFKRCETAAGSMFTITFFFAAAISSVLNNDAMILLLTPLVIGLAREMWPRNHGLHRVHAYAVFAAVGVAPVVIANPINLLVADQAGIGFNAYLLRMVPAAALCWLITWCALRVALASELSTRGNRLKVETPSTLTPLQMRIGWMLLGIVLVYPVASMFHECAVAVVSMLGGLLLTIAIRAPIGRVLVREVEWGILLFMLGAFAIGIGLKNAGAVEALARLYHDGGLLVLASGSAVGSALLNNHPMTILNLFALESSPISREIHYLVALAGGDIGPRLLPSGSLAGLLWLAACRQAGVRVPLRWFFTVGAITLLPALLVSVAALLLLSG